MKRFILFSLFVSFWFSACYEDKGKYGLIDYNDVTLDVVASLTKKTIILGDTVRIVPKMTWKYPDRDTLDTIIVGRWDWVMSFRRIGISSISRRVAGSSMRISI